jgi:hypothetical protein
MRPADILADILADGLRVAVHDDGRLLLQGRRSVVEHWQRELKSRSDSLAELKSAAREVAKLRRLLRALLHDAPHEIEPEIRRTLRDDALVEAIACYQLAHDEYTALGELPGQPNFRGKKP